ncbi:FAD synthase [Candidatus Woesearchaeota archaeon]|nr:FAD synthase [Candidatus Woesearchaeota archaeon]
MKKVMCAGTFDIIHPGHLYMFSEAKKYGDTLVVVVARDSTSEKIKGKKPLHNEMERLEAVRSLQIVDKALLGKEGNIFDIVMEIKPDVICLGYDQKVSKEELEKELSSQGLKADIFRLPSHKPHIYKSSHIAKKNTNG